MTKKQLEDTAAKNAKEVSRILKGSAVTQLGARGAALLEKHTKATPDVGVFGIRTAAEVMQERFAGNGEVDGTKAEKTIEGTVTRVKRTDQADEEPEPAKDSHLLPGEKIDFRSKPGKVIGFTPPTKPAEPDVVTYGDQNEVPVPAAGDRAPTLGEQMAAQVDEGAELARAGLAIFAAAMPPVHERLELSLSVLEESPTNPRKTFGGIEKLAATMVAYGCLTPLIVRPIDGGPNMPVRYEIVAGHRRFRAAPIAQLSSLPCEVRLLTDAQVSEIQLTENLQRSDLLPLEQAEGYEALAKKGLTVEQIAEKIGQSKGTVYGRMKLLALSPLCRKALADGKIPLSVAEPMARSGRHVDQERALKQIRARAENNGGEINAREEIEWLQKEFTRSMKSPPFNAKDSMLVAGEPACTDCPRRTKNMPPELFEGRPADVCTDVPCFLSKCRANFEAAAESAKKEGARVMSFEEGAQLFKHDTLGPDCNLVELDAPNTADPKRRSWRDLLAKLPEEKRPQSVIAPDRNLGAHLLIDRKELTKALAEETGAKWAVEAAPPRKTAAEREAARGEKADQKIREATALAALEKVAAVASTKGMGPLEWSAIYETVAGASSYSGAVMQSLGVDSFAALDAKMKKANPGEVTRVVFLMAAIENKYAAAEDGYSEELKALCKTRGVDLQAIEKATALMISKGEEPGKAKKKAAKK